MQMKEAYKNGHLKILDVSLEKGEKMPLHKASSDAFIINRKGTGKIIFSDKEVVLNPGDNYIIKAQQPHQLEIIENFEASIIFEPEAQIDFL